MILLANWKQNLTKKEVETWFEEFANELDKLNENGFTHPADDLEIVIAPAFHYLYLIDQLANQYNLNFLVKGCAQDLSPYENGSHTGEVGAAQVKDVCEYVLLGHSERKKLGETKEMVAEKVRRALEAGLKPILCFASDDEFEYYKSELGASIIYAYEPPSAISTHEGGSTGAEPVSEVLKTADRLGLEKLIYGGSVDDKNILNYIELPKVSGFLVGSASLNPSKFAKMALTFYV